MIAFTIASRVPIETIATIDDTRSDARAGTSLHKGMMQMSAAEFRLPGTSHRTLITGRTGTGKTRQGVWVLSLSPFNSVPYVIVDYKLEGLFAQSERIKEIGLNEVPKHPGLYIVRPDSRDDDAVEAWLWQVHKQENCGLYVDEGYGIRQHSLALRSVLTQGRSKNLPCIFLSQRPAWISPFVVSEADFISVFPLTKIEDQKRIREVVPRDPEFGDQFEWLARQPPYHSYWYDVGRNTGFRMLPCPSDDDILQRIDDRLKPKKGRL